MTDKGKVYDDVNIRHFKLVSGEEVISYVGTETSGDTLIHLERPLQIHRMGMGSFFFSKWHPFSKKDECVVNPNQIVSHSECADVVKERYIKICLDISKDKSEAEFVDKAQMEEFEDEVQKKAEEILTPLLTKDGKGPTYH